MNELSLALPGQVGARPAVPSLRRRWVSISTHLGNAATLVLCIRLVAGAWEECVLLALGALLLLALSGWLSWSRRKRTLLLPEGYLALVVLIYVMPLLYFQNYPSRSPLVSYTAPPNSALVLRCVVWAMAAFVVGVHLVPKPRLAGLRRRLERSVAGLKANWAVGLWGIGMAVTLCRALGLQLPGAAGPALQSLRHFAILVLFAMTMARGVSRPYRLACYGMILIECVQYIGQGAFGFAVMMIMGLVIIFAHYRRVIPVFLIPLGVVLAAAWLSVRPAIRAITWAEDPQVTRAVYLFGEGVVKTSRQIGTGDIVTPAMDSAMARLNHGDLYGAVLRHTPDREPFARGETLWAAVRHVFMPRVFFPDKEVFGGRSDWTMRFSGRSYRHTSVGMGLMLEFYANFGLPGVVVGLLVLGWLLAIAASLMQGATPVALAMVMFCAEPFATTEGGSLASHSATMIWRVAVLALILFFSRRMHVLPTRQRAVPARARAAGRPAASGE